MRQGRIAFLSDYGLALASTGVSALARWLFPLALAPAPYLGFYPAVVVSAALGGVGPGLMATFLSLLLVNFVFGRFSILDTGALMRQVIWVVASIGVSLLAGMQRSARKRAEQEAATARAAVQALKQQAELIDPARAEVITQEMQRAVRMRAGREDAVDDSPADPRRFAPAISGAVVAATGLLVMIGWGLGLDTFKSLLPGLATMKANTALCFLLAGLSLALRRRRAARLACAGAVLAVAGLTLAEYLAGADFGIDQLLFPDAVDSHTVFPGRMVDTSAIAFLLCGASLALSGTRMTAGRIQQALAVCAGVIGGAALLGYAYGAMELYRFFGLASMAVTTAVSFIVLAAGLVFTRPDGPAAMLAASGPAAQLMRKLLPMVLLVPPAVGLMIHLGLKHGAYSEGMDIALLTLSMMLGFVALIVRTAHALDLTDAVRRETEAQLRNQAELMNQTREPLIVRELGGAILFWNLGAAALYGWPAIDAVGRRTQNLLRTEGTPQDQKDAMLLETGHWEGELVQTTREGRSVIVESRQAAIRSSDGSILVLESDNDITGRRLAEERVQASLNEKEVMLKEIHHRVKNNLQIISSLVNLQVEAINDPSVNVHLQDIRDRVRSMTLVHEKLYQTESLSELPFDEYVRSLLSYLKNVYGKSETDIHFTMDLQPVSISIEEAVPCGLMLNELVTNAIKHAFQGRTLGTVATALRRNPDGTICLRVSDDGVGLPNELDWRQTNSLGLRLVQMLIKQIRGSVQTGPGPGAEFRISFKPKEKPS